MARRYHLNPITGAVGRCRAKAGGCPFAGELHYESELQAIAAYEKMAPTPTIPAPQQRRGLQSLNRIARKGQDQSLLLEAAERGSDRALLRLSANPHSSAAVLEAAHRNALAVETRVALVAHPAFPVHRLSGDAFAEAWSRGDEELRGRLLVSSGLRDEHLSSVGKGDFSAALTVKNLLSQEKINEVAEENFVSLSAALRSGRYQLTPRMQHLRPELLREVVADSSDPQVLLEAATQVCQDRSPWGPQLRWALAANRNSPAAALHALLSGPTTPEEEVALYRHGNADDALRTTLRTRSATVAALHRVEKLVGEHGGSLDAALGRRGEEKIGQRRRILFSPQRVAALNLTPLELDTYLRYHQGTHLLHTAYDPVSGVYEGDLFSVGENFSG